MDTSMIRKLLRNFKCFKGVYSSDMLPYDASLPLNIIANTDPSYLPGEHWISITISSNGDGYYFDSFGLPPLKEDIYNFLETKCKNGWRYNQLPIQNIDSALCGHYCVLYIIYRCQGLSAEQFLSKFHYNTAHNDKLIAKIFKNFNLVFNS